MMTSVETCPACGTNSFNNLLSCVDYTVSHETFQIVQCKNCGLGITNPRPENSQLEKYYDSKEYISHSGTISGIGAIYRIVRSFSLKRKRSLLERLAQNKKSLDYGCGTGDFVKELNQNGWDAYGVEPSTSARTKALELNPSKIFPELTDLKDQKFDVITLWHVLEHIPNLHEIIPAIKLSLQPAGTLVIAVPNPQSPDSQHYRDKWAAYDVPRHLWHFQKNSMEQLMKAHGFKIAEILPMKFDAFYVSMLSEKYLNNNKLGLTGIIKGFTHGLISNIKAAKTNNYSSLIYIVKSI
jgi:2-polyprenyl-3-methyl-5-hydroxy-6-metoxy-1,4-benzoquinol methylase